MQFPCIASLLSGSSVSLLACTILVTFFVELLADLPVHCTQPEVVGHWRLHVGHYHGDGAATDPRCGYRAPDAADGHHDLTPPVRNSSHKERGRRGGYWLADKFHEEFTVDVLLQDWTATFIKIEPEGQRHIDTDHLPRGMWTMVYDEGISIVVGDTTAVHSFFAFSKYVLRDGDDDTSTNQTVTKLFSRCNVTLLGWYHRSPSEGTTGESADLCYWGERVEALDSALHLGVLEVHVPVNVDSSSISSLIEAGSSRAAATKINESQRSHVLGHSRSEDISGRLGMGRNLATSRQRLEHHMKKARRRRLPVRWSSDKVRSAAWLQSWLVQDGNHSAGEHSTAERLLDTFSPPVAYGLPGFSSEEVIGPARARALEEQRTLAGELGKRPEDLTTDDMHGHWGGPPARNHHAERRFSLQGQMLGPDDWKTLQNFDWRSVTLSLDGGENLTGFVPPVADQGRCGSCFAVATTSMLTARLMLRYPELKRRWDANGDRISWYQQLHCNEFVQGCDGGYPYLVARWASQNDIVTDRCHESRGGGTVNSPESRSGGAPVDPAVCSSEGSREARGNGGSLVAVHEACADRFRVPHFRYVGGSLGRCGSHHLCEAAIKEELYKGGPLVASIEPDYDGGFEQYTDGVFHRLDPWPAEFTEVPPKNDADCRDTECYVWRKVDHSMLLVGWGEQEECLAPVDGGGQDRECDFKFVDEHSCKAHGCRWKAFPYWILQNSWKPTWGRKGYMYVGPRGQNPLRAEQMAVAADPVRVEEILKPSFLSQEEDAWLTEDRGARFRKRWQRPLLSH